MFDIAMRRVKDAIVRPFLTCVRSLTFSPNYITAGSGVLGLIGVAFSALDMRFWAFVFYVLGRILDGVDGAYARYTNQVSDFGGYFDIIVDFTVYGMIPLGVTAAHPEYRSWVALCFLEVTFFVNSAGLFFLSALIERNVQARKAYSDKKEVTTLKMPPALIEGTESLIFFGALIIFPEVQFYLYVLFAYLVCVTIVQRLLWA